ncbi:MAG TPA: DUF2786 domain-containing protein [Rhodocyclaceae bacterium]|jgi:hypothetical protein|nr:DUF2786 domain-containing protein [Rhodocyclaceae bacterium]
MSDHKEILAKIKKCLALSASSNEHEAEAALRQARKLMEAYGITDLDIRAAEAEEQQAKAGAKSHPSNWETMLAVRIGDAFGCRVIFTEGFFWDEKGTWCFIGCGPSPEIAHYAFTVLLRQAKRARESHIKTKLKRCKVSTKTRRADLFSEGWVRSVVGTIAVFSGNEQQATAIDAYMAKHHPSLGKLKTRDRNDGRKLRDHEHDDYAAGSRSGRGAQLNRGMESAEQPLSLESVL